MPRTPEQVAADDALTAAIEAVRVAYREPEDVDDGAVLLEYIVLARLRRWDSDGDPLCINAYWCRDNFVPLDLSAGMLDYALTRQRKRIAED